MVKLVCSERRARRLIMAHYGEMGPELRQDV